MKDNPALFWTPDTVRQQLADSSRVLADLTASMVYDNPLLLKYLLEVTWLDRDPWAQRASRVVSICSCRFHELFKPYCAEVLRKLNGLKSNGARRNLLKIFAEVPVKLSKKEGSELINSCFNYLTGAYPVAIKYYSMQILYKKSLDIPEIGVALSSLIEQDLPDSSPGLRNLGEKILKLLQRDNFQQYHVRNRRAGSVQVR